jgi:metal-sulfur cluster biosynthetic enzyme
MTSGTSAAPNRGALVRQLCRVIEPCSIAMCDPVEIAEMGLVENVELIEGHMRVMLCLTDPGRVHLSAMRQFITDVLLELPGIQSVEMRQTATELWTPARMGRELPAG